MGWHSAKQKQQIELADAAAREAFRIFDNQQSVYDSLRSNLVAGAEDADFLAIYKAGGDLRIVIACPKQRSRMIKLGLVCASVVPDNAYFVDQVNTFLTDKGVRVYKRLEHAFRGTTFDPVWGRAAMAKKNIQVMTPKNDVYRKGIDDSIERHADEASLQTFVKGLRTVWSQRPRLTRFTIRSWLYKWNIWLNGTTPDIPMIDWAAFSLSEWSDEDRKAQRQLWHDSDLLAFWLCPEGIDAGIEAHDEFLRICEKRGIKSSAKRKEVISDITGIAAPKPPKKKSKEKASKAIDEILGHLNSLDDPNKEMIEVHQFGKPKFAVNVDEYGTEYFNSYDDAMKFTKRKQEYDSREIYNRKYKLRHYY